MKKIPLSVLIITYNEEVNIRHALESVVGWSNEVFVVDSFSEDSTVSICEEYADRGVKVWQHAFENYSAQRNWALTELPWTNKWLFSLDADESVMPDLAEELLCLFGEGAGPNKDFYYVKRRFIFLRRWLKHASSYPLWLVRLFRIGDAQFIRPINEQVCVSGEAGYLKHDLLHDDRKGISGWLENHNRYSTLEAREYMKELDGSGGNAHVPEGESDRPDVKRQKKLRFFIHLPCRPLLIFIYMYIWKRGFLDGRSGFVYCVLKSMNQLFISGKIYEARLLRGKQMEKKVPHSP